MANSLPYRIGALAFILDDEDNLLLVQLNAYKDTEWNVPGGGREEGETPLQNALRETSEELNIDATELELLGQAEEPLVYDFPADIDLTLNPLAKIFRGQQKDCFIFRCSAATKAKIQIDPGELKASMWCAANDLGNYLIFPNQTTNYTNIIKTFLGLNHGD